MALYRKLGDGFMKLNNHLGDVRSGIEELKTQGSGWLPLVGTAPDIR